ncbi:hypothetical protein PENSPDRAFT_403206 [Peniophora sp. CONT]|nr:hypothetical protein PENSPDRAFT_403206 [Peniophora sp. CONT]
MTFYFMLGRLYSNSLLATLNMRNAIRKSAGRSAGTHSTLELGSVSTANMFARPTDHTHSAGVVVRIDQEIERDGKLDLAETDSEYKHNNVKATAF